MMDYAVSSLDAFRFKAMRLWFLPERNIQFHSFPGRTLRSAFGAALKEAACVDPDSCNKPCMRPDSCAYGRFFAPSDTGLGLESLPSELPAGVIVRFPFAGPVSFEQNEPLPIDLVMIGRAIAAEDVFLRSIDVMVMNNGLGAKRVRLHPYAIESLSGGSDSAEPVGLSDLIHPNDKDVAMMEVSLLAPLELRIKGQYLSGVHFHELIWSGAHRLQLLTRVHCLEDEGSNCSSELELWRDRLASASREIRRVGHSFVPEFQLYRSSGAENAAKMRGILGRAVFEGNMELFLPVLRALQYVHLGKHATFGWGQIGLRWDLLPA